MANAHVWSKMPACDEIWTRFGYQLRVISIELWRGSFCVHCEWLSGDVKISIPLKEFMLTFTQVKV